jgi:hypothetical protein
MGVSEFKTTSVETFTVATGKVLEMQNKMVDSDNQFNKLKTNIDNWKPKDKVVTITYKEVNKPKDIPSSTSTQSRTSSVTPG